MFSDSSKELALNAIASTIDRVKLHSAAPTNGVGSEISGAEVDNAGTSLYGSASAGSVDLAANVEISVPAGGDVQWFSLWDGTTFRGQKAFTTPDSFANPGTATITSLEITLSDL